MGGKVYGLVGVLVLATLMGGCAKPPAEVESLRRRMTATDLAPLEAELKAQADKFALFRSYRRTDEILSALKAGREVPPQGNQWVRDPVATKCAEEGSVVCFCYGETVTCVERSH